MFQLLFRNYCHRRKNAVRLVAVASTGRMDLPHKHLSQLGIQDQIQGLQQDQEFHKSVHDMRACMKKIENKK